MTRRREKVPLFCSHFMEINGLNHITLSVSNLETSFSYYKNILGLKPMVKWKTGAYFTSGSLWLALVLDKEARKASLPEYTHFAFDVDNYNFAHVKERILNSGSTVFKENSSEGLSLYFLDPDGHKLEIHCGNIFSRIEKYKKDNSNKYTFFE